MNALAEELNGRYKSESLRFRDALGTWQAILFPQRHLKPIRRSKSQGNQVECDYRGRHGRRQAMCLPSLICSLPNRFRRRPPLLVLAWKPEAQEAWKIKTLHDTGPGGHTGVAPNRNERLVARLVASRRNLRQPRRSAHLSGHELGKLRAQLRGKIRGRPMLLSVLRQRRIQHQGLRRSTGQILPRQKQDYRPAQLPKQSKRIHAH